MDLDVATVTALGTAIATVILAVAPCIRAYRERVDVKAPDPTDPLGLSPVPPDCKS